MISFDLNGRKRFRKSVVSNDGWLCHVYEQIEEMAEEADTIYN